MPDDAILAGFKKARRDDNKAIRAEIKAGGEVYDFSQMALSRRFAAVKAGELAYDHSMRLWYTWTGSVWRPEERAEAFEAVKAYCEAERRRTIEPRDTAALGKSGFISGIEELSRSDPRMAVHQGMWDCNPHLLGTPGGVVDLTTGEVRKGSPDDWMVRQTSVEMAPEGTPHPEWTRFLCQATQNDPQLTHFLQKWAGYCLTGDVSEEVLAFLYGDGGNGKGVFVGTMAAVLGSYAVAMPMEAFTNGGKLPQEYYRAQMAGARLVTSSETETGRTWAEAQIKELTGNETPVSARHPHGRPFTYRPQFKLMFMGNHAPSLKSRSPAMERRLRIVPFVHKPEKADLGLKDRLQQEYPAILRWMVEGCLAWRAERLGTASAIQNAGNEYFERQDVFGRWLGENCILDAALSIRPGQLFSDYRAWCQANGETPMSSPEFTEKRDRTPGLRSVKVNGTQWVRGIGLKKEDSHNDRF